jgi:hypothetical protein
MTCVWGCNGACDCHECIPDECCGFDQELRERVYLVVCLLPEHRDRQCPCDHEMFRLPTTT